MTQASVPGKALACAGASPDRKKSPNPAALAALRETVRRLEGGEDRQRSFRLPLGVPMLDRLLGGGLSFGACHDAIAPQAGLGAALFGFILALFARWRQIEGGDRALILISEPLAGQEFGLPYAPGLAAFGLDPACLLLIRPRDRKEALYVLEEALRDPSAPFVALELLGEARLPDAFAARRLTLAAEAGGGIGFLLRHGATSDLPLGLRLSLLPGPSIPMPGGGPGPPVFDLSLIKNRLGPTGRFRLAFDPAEAVFSSSDRTSSHVDDAFFGRASPPFSGPLVSAPADRPGQASLGAGFPFARAG